ncbi:MAG: hypothetical protein ABI619_04310 [Betaproteobacteria bacterium]
MHAYPLAGKSATPAMLVYVPRLVAAYYTGVPDASVPAQRVPRGIAARLSRIPSMNGPDFFRVADAEFRIRNFCCVR